MKTNWKKDTMKGVNAPINTAGSALLVILTIAVVIMAMSGFVDTAVSEVKTVFGSAPTP